MIYVIQKNCPAEDNKFKSKLVGVRSKDAKNNVCVAMVFLSVNIWGADF
jgi:hypothetical protein